jgi:hypothetical protein
VYSTLRVVTPPAIEPVSLTLARQHLRLDHESDDVLLAGYIAAARQWAEGWLGRVLITQTLRWTMAEDPPAGALPLLPMPLLVLPVILSFPQIWNRRLDLPRSPVQSVLAVTTVDQDGNSTILDPSADYSVDLSLDPGRLCLSRDTYPTYARHVSVDFVAGYGDTGLAAPASIIAGLLLLIGFLYENRGDAGGEMPEAAKQLMWPHRVMYFGG